MLNLSPLRTPRVRYAHLALAASALAALATVASPVLAAAPPNRLRADAALSERTPLPQGVSKRLQVSEALGSVSADAQLGLMSLVLAPSAAQSAALDQLLQDQQNPSSPQFHKWLTPVQFGEKFGVSDADLAILQNWLTSKGFSVVGVAPSRNQIQFTGSAATAQAAFGTGFGRFKRGDQTFFSNTSAPTIPAAFSGIVSGVQGLSSYRLQPHIKQRPMTEAQIQARLSPELTTTGSNGSVVHELVPYDVRQIYSANALVSSGYTGTGITIAVIGQTAVNTAQLADFQTLTGQAVKPPTLTLVPNSGVSTIYTGDETESEADLEYAGGVAPGATINFVYTGDGTGTLKNPDVLTALEYAITSNAGQIITMSYGGCEPFEGASSIYTVEPYLRQASAQGQTFVVSSGDSGAAGCDSDTVANSYDGLAVEYPASSPYATGVGGTMFVEGTGNYWSATNNSQYGSALGYIPEAGWNESDASGLGSSGGGASVVFSKPSWQAGVGVPADGVRDVPDVAFSSAGHDPYFFCTADTTYSQTVGRTTYTASCTSTTTSALPVAGTSLAAPSFAGMLAITEQANGGQRLGNINPSLYSLAATTPAVFNDVTTGTNKITCSSSGVFGCVGGTVGYSAGTGYDQVTGLGSVNIGSFSAAITAANTANIKTPTFVVSLVSQTSTYATFTITVGSNSSSTVPTGTVSLSLDGGTATAVTLTSGTATYSAPLSGLSAGTHTLAATYSGDANYSAAKTSGGFVIVSGTASFSLSLAPSTLSVASGSTGSATVSLTSTNYTGLVLYTIVPASGSSAAPGCFYGANGDVSTIGATNTSGNSVFLDNSVTAGGTSSAAFTYHSLASDCSSSSSNVVPAQRNPVLTARSGTPSHGLPWTALAFSGFLFGGLALRRRQSGLLSGALLAVAFSIATLAASGCGSGSAPLNTGTTPTTPTSPTTTTGTYTYVVTAVSYPATTTTASANFTLTVH